MRNRFQLADRAIKTRLRRAEIALVGRPWLPVSRPESWRDRLEALLAENVIPYWRNHAVDPNGGYHERISWDRSDQMQSPRHARTQARTLWFFSRLLRSDYQAPSDLPSAQHGFDFLIHRLWDPRRGGLYADIGAAEGPDDGVKHVYDQVMALDAFLEYHRATGDASARSFAEDTLDVIVTRFTDGANGYWEGRTFDWAISPVGAGLLVNDPASKTTLTHVNVLNALSNAHTAGLADLSGAVRTLLALLDEKAILPGSTMMGEVFQRDWAEPIGRPTVSYGHDIERIWMAGRARRAIGAETADYRALFTEIVRWGWDRRRGGFYFSGRQGRPARDLKKQWWVQAETLVACSAMRGVFEDVDGLFEGTLGWIESSQTDWAGGEWHDTVAVDGSITGPKAWEWKTGYHTTRSLFAALEMLDE